jgi:hypothetical protein
MFASNREVEDREGFLLMLKILKKAHSIPVILQYKSQELYMKSCFVMNGFGSIKSEVFINAGVNIINRRRSKCPTKY